MALFKRDERRTVAGRAYVVPAGSRATYGNTNNVSADGSVKAEVRLVAISAADAQPVDPGITTLEVHVPNWVLYVMHDAGTNEPLAAHLPERVEVDVSIDVDRRTIVGLDVESAARELTPFRTAAIDEWKHTGSALAPVRNIVKLPGAAARGARGLLRDWRGAVTDIADGFKGPVDGAAPKRGWTDKEIEQLRRTANLMAHRYQLHPDERVAARDRAHQSLPAHAQQYAAGQLHIADFDALVMMEVASTAITTDEAAGFYTIAGLEPPDRRPVTNPE